MKIYLASRWTERYTLRQWRDALVGTGHIVTCHWIDHDTRQGNFEKSADWAEHCAKQDLDDLDAVDLLILYISRSVTKGRKQGGLWVEFGYALARGIETWLVGPRTNIFTYLPGVRQFPAWEDALSELGKER